MRQTGYFRPYFKGRKSLKGKTLHVPYVQVWYGGVAQIENQAGKGCQARSQCRAGTLVIRIGCSGVIWTVSAPSDGTCSVSNRLVGGLVVHGAVSPDVTLYRRVLGISRELLQHIFQCFPMGNLQILIYIEEDSPTCHEFLHVKTVIQNNELIVVILVIFFLLSYIL